MAAKKKVAFFLPGSVGGAERVSVTIGKMLPQEEFEVKFVVVGKYRGRIEEYIPKVYETDFIRIRNIWDFPIGRLIAYLKKDNIDAVFCSLISFNIAVIVAAKYLGLRIIIRNNNYFSLVKPYVRFLCKCFYRYADWIISQQEEMTEVIVRTLNVSSDKVITLQNPIDVCDIALKLKYCTSPYPKDPQTNYLWVGRINRNKGQDILARAFEYVHREIPDSHLYIVGKCNPSERKYQDEIICDLKNKDLTEYVHFVGFDSNPYKWMKYCDCFVLPSRIQGLPNALIEAQYLGKPAAAARCIPIIERIVVDGITGFTARPEDPEDLALAMMKAVKLGHIESHYRSASDKDFIELFA